MTDSWLMAVDGTGLYVRCAKAARYTGMTAPDGTPTGALTIFAQSLASIVRSVRPQRMLIAWDGGTEALNWRRALCPGYKRNRAVGYRTDPWWRDLREFGAVREFCNAAQIAQWCFSEFEADDMLGAASRLARQVLPEAKMIVASDDKDVLQLAEDGRVWVRGLGRDGVLTDAETVELLFGVRPEHMTMMRALEGDRSDGIPGMPGIGRVRAVRMLHQAEFRWPPPDVPPGGEVDAWFRIMDLRDPPERPEDHDKTGFLDIRQTTWIPGNVLPVLEKYGMRSMAERWSAGHFW